MSIYHYYERLLASNVGDVTVLYNTGEMKVIKHLILARCPMLKNDLKEKSPGEYILDMKQFKPFAVKTFFEYIYWHSSLTNIRTMEQLACFYEICKKYELKHATHDMYITEEIIGEVEKRQENNTFEHLQIFSELEDKTLFNKYLIKAKEVMRNLLGEHRCYDSIVPGTAGRPENYCSYICCEHSFPVPEPKYLKLSAVRLMHDRTTCCYSLTSGVMGDTPYTNPETYETKFCCKHGKKKKQELVKEQMASFSKLPKNIKKTIVSGLIINEDQKAIIGDITEEDVKSESIPESTPETKSEPKEISKETPTDDPEDDFVQILTEEIVKQQENQS